MVAPALGGQQGLGRDQPDVGLARIFLDRLQQGGGEGLLGRRRLGRLVAIDQGLGEAALLVGPRELQRLLGEA